MDTRTHWHARATVRLGRMEGTFEELVLLLLRL